VSFTLETTLWCDADECMEWWQFNYSEAQGHPRMARQLARRGGWTWNATDGDRCSKHNPKKTENQGDVNNP
jgi:hypothetical protein